MRFRAAIGLMLWSLGAAWPAVAQSPVEQPVVREISKVAGEIYRFRNDSDYSIFVVTPSGIVVADPINADAADWLKQQLERNWPNRPVKFLVYSQAHGDRSLGGQVFADTATVVAHDRTKEAILEDKRPTALPHVTFNDRLGIELGGTVMELTRVGRNHSGDSIVMRFPREKVLFAADFVPVDALPSGDLRDADLDEWIDALRKIEDMEFETLAPGHGPLGNKGNVTAFREYLEDLRAQVLAGIGAGKSLEEIRRSVDLSRYREWAGYDEMRLRNIDGMYRLMQAKRRGN